MESIYKSTRKANLVSWGAETKWSNLNGCKGKHFSNRECSMEVNIDNQSKSLLYTMDQHAFAFSLIIEGATEKVLQFIMPLKSIYKQNLGFIEQKCIFEHC
jgi:hypothetical protein